MKCMVDTNIFNKILDGVLRIEQLPANDGCVVTHVQIDELNATKDMRRKTQLLSQFEATAPARIPTASFAFGVSLFGQSCWGDGIVFQIVKNDLDAANGGKRNNCQDALIGEASITNGLTLVTCDWDLAEAVKRAGGLVVSFAL